MNLDQRTLSRRITEAPIGLALCDMDGRIRECNEAFADIIGVTVSVAKTGQLDYWKLTPTEYHAFEKGVLDLLMTVGEYGPYEKEYYYQGGGQSPGNPAARIPVSLRSRLVEGLDGGKYIWSSVSKVDRLRGGFDQLFQELPIAVVVSDLEGNFVAANQEYAELIGRSLREALAISYWNITPKEYKDREDFILKTLKDKGYYFGYRKHYIKRNKEGENELIPVSLDLRRHVIHGRQYLSAAVRTVDEIEGGEIHIADEPIKPLPK